MKQQKLGIAIYPRQAGEKATIAYLKLAHKYAIKRVFANFLAVKNNSEGHATIALLTRVFKVAQDLGMNVILDVNPAIYENFQLPQLELAFFQKMHVTGIRLDQAFEASVVAQLSNNQRKMTIQLNASVNLNSFQAAFQKGANLEKMTVCHNFYPMQYTALAYEKFVANSAYFQSLNVEVSAFITLPAVQKALGPWNINQGMPSLETLRNATLANQVRHLTALGTIDWFIISQQPAQEAQFKLLTSLVTTLPKTIFEVTDLQNLNSVEMKILAAKHYDRQDRNDYFIRSTQARITFQTESIPPRPTQRKMFQVGEILIANDLFGRYKGELHVVKKSFPNCGKRNYIGVVEDYQDGLLPYAYSQREFRFK